MRLRFVSEGGNTGAGQLTTVHSASHVTFLTAVRRVPHRYGIIDDNEAIDHHDVQNVGLVPCPMLEGSPRERRQLQKHTVTQSKASQVHGHPTAPGAGTF